MIRVMVLVAFLLLAGYAHVAGRGFDTQVGTIERKGGPHIGYDIGAMAGDKAIQILDSHEPYTWWKVQLLNGQRARLVMQAGGRLTVSFDNTSANFEVSSIRTSEDMADVLLMLGTYTHPKN
jgi:hypothetical protein